MDYTHYIIIYTYYLLISFIDIINNLFYMHSLPFTKNDDML